MIDLAGLRKADVLAALYNASRPQEMGFLSYDPEPMTPDEARQLLEITSYFDYIKGRVMKVNLDGDELNPRLYDQDNGGGAAEAAIEFVRSGAGSASPELAATHEKGKRSAAALTMNRLHEEPRQLSSSKIQLGLSDVANKLEPAIKRAKG